MSDAPDPPPVIRLEAVGLSYGTTRALDGITLEIPPARMMISALNALTLSPALCALLLRHSGPRRGVMALRRIEFESSRLLQAQILFLKGEDLAPYRDAVSAALEQRHDSVRKLWRETLASIGVDAPGTE